MKIIAEAWARSILLPRSKFIFRSVTVNIVIYPHFVLIKRCHGTHKEVFKSLTDAIVSQRGLSCTSGSQLVLI